MTKRNLCWFALLVLVSSVAYSQIPYSRPPGVVHPNQELHVRGLPSLKALSDDASDVLATSLAISFHDKQVCCERNSALEDRLPQTDLVSLKEVADKVQGRQLLSDGRPIIVTAEYFAPAAVNSGQVINAILDKRAPIMEWRSRVYVVSGAIFDETVYADGAREFAIRKFLLLDARFSDSRREVTLTSGSDEWNEVQGMLLVKVTPQ